MKRVMSMTTIFLLGGGLYCCLEVLWRGFSHPSMAVVGGLCVLAVGLIDKLPLQMVYKMLLCALSITTIEGMSGVVLNVLLRLNVWDYSELPLNLFGQVCVWFSVIWFALSLPALLFCRVLNRYVFA